MALCNALEEKLNFWLDRVLLRQFPARDSIMIMEYSRERMNIKCVLNKLLMRGWAFGEEGSKRGREQEKNCAVHLTFLY